MKLLYVHERFGALLVFLLTSPVLLFAWAGNRGAKNLFLQRRAVIPTAMTGTTSLREMDYAELNGVTGLWRRWPQLWSVVRGDFAWVGNRPLTREQAAELENEFEQLWLAAPVGLVSLADTFGDGEACNDDTRAHASFYAVRGDRRLDRQILRRLFSGALPKN